MDVGAWGAWANRRDPGAALRRVRDDVGDCTRCKLSRGRKRIVFGAGDPEADLVVVGEAPCVVVVGGVRPRPPARSSPPAPPRA